MNDSVGNPYSGLPELTNSNGSFCKDSCETQAWSSATMLDFIHDFVLLQKS